MCFLRELGEDQLVREAKERGEFLRRDGVRAFERDPLGAGEVGRGGDALALCEFGEGFVGGFEGEEDGGWFERSDRKHFAGDFEYKVVAPLHLFGGVREREAEFADGFDRVHDDAVEVPEHSTTKST